MVLTKEEIWDRLQTDSVWVAYGVPGTPPTALFAAVAERQFRYVVAIWINGNEQQTTGIAFYKQEEDLTFTRKFSPIPVAPADFRQIPEGQYSVVDPILTCEGGTRLFGRTDIQGLSLNVTIAYWDWDV